MRKYELQKYFSTWEFINPLSVTLTCKQRVHGEILDTISLTRNITHFLNRLNYRLFKKGFSRYGKRIGVITVIEGDSSTRLHVHMTVDRPDHISFELMSSLIMDCWKQTKFGYNNNEVKPVIDEGWVKYQLKHRTKQDGIYSSIDWINTHTNCWKNSRLV